MYYNIHASKRQKPQLCGSVSNNVASLMYASNSQKFILCGNALGDDTSLIYSSSWQQCKFRGSASNSAASLAHASKRQKPTAQGNTLGKHACVGLRPVRAKALHIKALRMLLSLQDVPTPSNIAWVLPRAVRYCPFGAHITWDIKRTSQFIMLISNATFIAIQIYYTNITHTVHLKSNL